MRPTLYYRSFFSFLVLKMSIPDRVTSFTLAFSYTIYIDLALLLICISPSPHHFTLLFPSLFSFWFSAHVTCILPPFCLSNSSPCGSSLRAFFLLSCAFVSATIMTISRLRKKNHGLLVSFPESCHLFIPTFCMFQSVLI